MTVRLDTNWACHSLRRSIGSVANDGARTASHPSEAAAMPAPAGTSSFAALLTSHILRDGEIVLLVLKPSFWFILLQSIPFTAAILVAYFIARVFAGPLSKPAYVEGLVMLIAARFVLATMHWMGRWYVLTDRRLIRLAGVFRIDVYDCSLRKVAHTQIISNLREQVFRLASIEIHPKDSVDGATVGVWQTVAQPEQVHEQINQAIYRAQCSG
jgi:hypothetical protein